jgi:hypothetical protein
MAMRKLLALIFLLCSAALPVCAQDTNDLTDAAEQIEAVRAVTATERKILVMKEMNLTTEEAEKFWPLYEEYRNEMRIVGDVRVRIITDYAASYSTMTNDLAKELLDDYVDYLDEQHDLTRKYIKKFRAILPDIKVTRYFQLEHKLDAVVDFELAARIPLME